MPELITILFLPVTIGFMAVTFVLAMSAATPPAHDGQSAAHEE